MISELENLSVNGTLVRTNSNQYFLNVHLLGSFGDIPSVSEINFLTGHTSYWACRFCTIQSDRKSSRMCFGNTMNNVLDPPLLRTIEELKSGDSSHGIKRPSLFKNLPSFINVYFLGMDESHMFGLNISTKLRDFFVGAVKNTETIIKLKKANCDRIGENLLEEGKKILTIFEGKFKDVLRNSSRARGVDYLVFLKYTVPTLVTGQLQYQLEGANTDNNSIAETIKALESILLACSIANQYTINDQELDKSQDLITIWLDFYKKYIPKEQSNINIHYLTHLVDIIKNMGPLRHISCRSMERRIQRMKRKIKSTTNPEKNVENIFIDEVYKNYNTRSIGNDHNTGTNMSFGGYFKLNASVNNYSLYGLKSLLLRLWKITSTGSINDEIKISESVIFCKKK